MGATDPERFQVGCTTKERIYGQEQISKQRYKKEYKFSKCHDLPQLKKSG